ncbi:DUF7669 domain-containing protein [Methylibium sp.]|uniref:DUF7669 domain-containing protein n=1 Tax=Methylibium sp. TaxID=2067992 RepID=UPI003BAAFE26
MQTISIDADPESADWTKQSWDLPPYKSPEFMAVVSDLDMFRQLAVFKHAVAKGLIVDDEWVGPPAADGAKPTPFWQLISQAIEDLGGEATAAQIKQAILERRPDAKASTMSAQITVATVNNRSRVYYNQNQKPRTCDTYIDILYNTGQGQYERYDPLRHGLWAIVPEGDGLTVQCIQAPESDPDDEGTTEPVTVVGADAALSGTFASEAHLRDYLAKSLPPMDGQPLTLYVAPNGDKGVEFPSGVGPMDLLARSSAGAYYVFELKRHATEDKTLGQVLRYMGWIQKHLAGDDPVYGVIVGSQTSQKLKYAATQVPNVRLLDYELQVKLSAPDPLGA